MKSKGLFLHWYVASLKSIKLTHSPFWRDVPMVTGVCILNFSGLRKSFNLLMSSMGLHRLFDFGTKINWLKIRVLIFGNKLM